ncbi:MAG: exodeoxyribonuclease V subunit alpha [Myxococcales bacterium]|nr:exodeoxyribonuclease V subunit alpha [Myxococcales bacterium]MCB9546886.1 exodeoxyribonuclease V subunit alpha [Myxococcales bacterium]
MSEAAALDTAWQRFRRLDKGLPPTELEALLRGLEGAVGPHGLDASAVTLAYDLARLADPGRTGLVVPLVLAVLVDLQQGSTRTPTDAAHLGHRLRSLLRSALPGEDAVEGRVRDILRLVGDAGGAAEIIGRDDTARLPLLLIDGCLAVQRVRHAEGLLASRLAARLARPVDVIPKAEAALEDVRGRPAFRGGQPVQLSDEQEEAVRASIRRSLALVSGGPGTGKTSIVVAMLRTLVRLGVKPEQIALAAPTGKAAWRMGEAIQGALGAIARPGSADERLMAATPVPSTLHRLLGYSPTADRFEHDAENPLAARVIVVDEGSMVDVFLMERLLAAARPSARLVILGDADQLPSVAAGAVFRDALAVADAASVSLTYSYRMRADDPAGRQVLLVARRVRLGDARLFEDAEDGTPLVQIRPRPAALEGVGVELLPVERGGLRAFLEHWYPTRVRRPADLQRAVQQTWRADPEGIAPEQVPELARLFGHLERARVLCVTRGFEAGTRRVNAWLHEATAREAGQPASVTFLVGEPVMMLHNDHDRQLFNGDQGLVLFVEDDDGRRRMAVFPRAGGGFRAFPLDALGSRLELAYALTVHKAQGSEYDEVALLLPDEDLPLLSRELLYTAITRSRRSVMIVGAEPVLQAGVRRAVVRHSGLADRIRAALGVADAEAGDRAGSDAS